MSNQLVTGVVDRTWTKQKSTRFGDKNLHYCEVDGVTFSTGFKKVFNDGEMVNAVVKFNYGELQYQPNETVSAGMPKATMNKPANNGNFGGASKSNYSKGSFPIGKTDGQMSIIRQSSMNRAVDIVHNMVVDGVFEPANEEEYLKKVIEVAYIVCDFGSGQDITGKTGEES